MDAEKEFYKKMEAFEKEVDLTKFTGKPENPQRINIDLDVTTVKRLRMMGAFTNLDKKNLSQAIINFMTSKYLPNLK